MARPIGDRIREVCSTLEKHGESGMGLLAQELPHIERSNLAKYCARAIKMGLISERYDNNIRRLFVHPNWREIIRQYKNAEKTGVKVEPVTKWTGVNSVFAMGLTTR